MESDGYFGEQFCRNMAWVDLLLLANHDDDYFWCRGIKVDVKRGQVGHGIETLAGRWKWSRGKVERFLKEHEKDKKIIRQKNNVTTLISVLNYESYQSNDKADGQQTVKQTDINKNTKNDKNIISDLKIESAALPPTFKKMTEPDFYNSIANFKNEFPKEMLRAFFDYWSEKDPAGKMKFQFNKTWEVKKRLLTWQSKPYNQNGTSTNRKINGSVSKSAGAERLLNSLKDDIADLNGPGSASN